MAKVGLNVRIDVTKLDKSRFYKGAKGTYLDLTTFIDLENKDQYDNNGFITQSQSKEEREAGNTQMPILGNVRVFYSDNGLQSSQQPASQNAGPDYGSPSGDDYLNDDIGF